MMKNKRVFAALLALLTLLLCGCQLAQEDAAETAGADRLIGVLVTTEYLDLFDMESYLRDNASQLVNGGNVSMDGNTSQYQGRLYAVPKTETLTNGDGETTERCTYVFEGIEGYAFFTPTITDGATGEAYHSIETDEGISDSHSSINITDDGESYVLEGTVYVCPTGNEMVTFYFNPIYQAEDGQVYAVTGNECSTDTKDCEGSIYTLTLDETTTINDNGVETAQSVSIETHLAILFPPEKITVLQMDGDHTILSQEEYEPGTLPDGLAPVSGAAYILVESHKQNGDGKPLVTREMYTPEDDSFFTFYPLGNGICAQAYTALDWTAGY